MAWDDTMPLDFSNGQGVDETHLDPIVKNLASLRNAAVLVGGFLRTTTAGPTVGTAELATITTPSIALEANSTYLVKLWGKITGTTANDSYTWQVRRDTLAGAVIGGSNDKLIVTAGIGYVDTVESYEITSVAVSRVFVASIVRIAGTGTATVQIGSHLTVWKMGSNSILTQG